MERSDSGTFRPDAAFLLRTPMLPFDALTAWGGDLELEALAGTDAASQEVYARALDRVRARARDLAREPKVREAVFIASPSLEEGLFAPEAADSARARAAEPALARYLSRMMTRPTPFGLFATCALGAVGTRTRLTLGDEAPKRATRLDMDYLCALCEAIARVPEIAAQLTYRPNNSLYRVAGHLRYSEVRGDDGQRRFRIVQLDGTEALERVLQHAAAGASIASLAENVRQIDPVEISLEDAQAFVQDLIDTQLLVSNLAPIVTGGDALAEIISQLSRLTGEGARIAATLERVRAMLVEIDRAPLGIAPERYRAVREVLVDLPTSALPRQLFQVDVVRRAPSAELSRAVTDEILAAVEVARRLQAPADNALLTTFARTFVERYGDREVPLAEALDPEFGVPFAPERLGGERAPLLAGLNLPDAGAASPTAGAVHPHLLRRLERAWARGEREIRLTEDDVEKLESPKSAPLPDAFGVLAILAAPSEEAVARGEYRLVFNGSHGPSGMRTLGRFCHVDEALDAHVRAHLRAEEALRPDAVFAEIVHVEERFGNVLARPVLREHEISFLGRSSAAAPLPIDDLRVSVQSGRIVLRSSRLGREVLPRLTTALNVKLSASLNYFLAALQAQDVHPASSWSWGALAEARYLPRVSFGRVLLRRAQWRLDAADLQRLVGAHGLARFLAARALRNELGMPRFVRLVDDDNELTVDWDNPLLVEGFVGSVAKRESCVLAEMFPAPEDLVCQGAAGRYTHELVVGFVRSEAPPARVALQPTSSTAPHLPGGECLFVKLYGGRVSLESLLIGLAPIIQSGLDAGWFRRWFFLRYGDPDLHMRLRFFGDSRALNEQLLPRLHEAASALRGAGRIWKVQLDTYVPETDRYGGPAGLALAERLFHVESQAVLALLEHLDEDEGETARWRTALRGVDDLLDALGLTFHEKWGVVQRLRVAFGREFSADSTALKHELGASFRTHRARIERDLDRSADEDSDLAPLLEIIGTLATEREALARELRDQERRGLLTRPVTQLAESYVHMFLNRLLRPPSRSQELVIYEYACRAYESRAARAKRG